MWKMGPNGPIINKKVENDPFLPKIAIPQVILSALTPSSHHEAGMVGGPHVCVPWACVGIGNLTVAGFYLGLMGQVRLTEGRAYALRVSFGPTNLACQNGSKSMILVDLWKKGKNASKTRRNSSCLLWQFENASPILPKMQKNAGFYVVRYKPKIGFLTKISQISDLIWDCRCPSGQVVQKWPFLARPEKRAKMQTS